MSAALSLPYSIRWYWLHCAGHTSRRTLAGPKQGRTVKQALYFEANRYAKQASFRRRSGIWAGVWSLEEKDLRIQSTQCALWRTWLVSSPETSVGPKS